MKTIVLAAGYATRLYPLTLNFPKPLLEVGGVTLLDRIVADIDPIRDINEHIIVTNHKFYGHFSKWAEEASSRYSKPIRVLDDGSVDNEHRVGAVKDLLLAIRSLSLDDDLLVVAADNVIDFSFSSFVWYFHRVKTSLIMTHFETLVSALQKTGVVLLDNDRVVLEMEEKPCDPKSNWAVPPFYLYKASDIPLILSSVENGCGFDAPGNLAHYLCDRVTIHAWKMNGKRYDIGDNESYNNVKKIFEKK